MTGDDLRAVPTWVDWQSNPPKVTIPAATRDAGMTAPRVVGLDLSLVSTGIALADRTFTTGRSLPKDATDAERCERIAHIRDVVIDECCTYWRPHVSTPAVDLVVMEGFSFGSPQGATEAGGLGWTIRIALHQADVPFAVVPPPTLKKYATGSGAAGKDDVKLAALSRLGLEFTGKGSGDRCDATWLRVMGLDALGCPLVAMPESHRAALTKITWPF